MAEPSVTAKNTRLYITNRHRISLNSTNPEAIFNPSRRPLFTDSYFLQWTDSSAALDGLNNACVAFYNRNKLQHQNSRLNILYNDTTNVS